MRLIRIENLNYTILTIKACYLIDQNWASWSCLDEVV